MSSKKYLSLEEAAEHLRIKVDELIRLREKGEVRGFADRGTWKFKADDIEELARRLQPDSNPEVPLLSDEDELGKTATIIKKGRGSTSDSDVKLVPDDRLKAKLTGSSAEISVLPDSDSDVRLTNDTKGRDIASDSDVKLVAPKGKDSDSDVKLADSDSDVRLSDSDSDVRLAPLSPSDSDVKLVDRGGKKKSSDSDVTLLPKGAAKSPAKAASADAPLVGGESVLLEDSGLSLEVDSGIRLSGSGAPLASDSGISLAGDSGISLSASGDSGISLASDEEEITFEEDSGISVQGDSGIQLAGDSGIRLAGDSGIRLSDAPQSDAKSKKQAPLTDELDQSVPMLLAEDRPDSGRTDVEVPLLAESGEMETVKLPSTPVKKGGDTSVVFLEDEEGSDKGLEAELEEEAFGSDEEELEVAEDILGEDEELDQLEVFDSDDALFNESFVEGGSAVGIPAMGSRIALPQEVEWSPATVALTGVSTVVLVMGAMLAVDLLRVVWSNGSGGVYPGELIGMFAGLFGGK